MKDGEEFASPAFSVIMPVFNAAAWLPETLRCVRDQTCEDWELIVVDDCSSDDSVVIAKKAGEDDARIHVIRLAQNSGPAIARNVAIEVAQGRYLAFLDADDVWLKDKLTATLSFMERTGYAFAYHGFRKITHDGRAQGEIVFGPEVLDYHRLHVQRGVTPLAVVIDRMQAPNFRFPVTEEMHEDYLAWLWMVEHGFYGHRIPLDLARYRLSAKSRNASKLRAALGVWSIYRKAEELPFTLAARYWLQYSWNSFREYHRTRPRRLVD